MFTEYLAFAVRADSPLRTLKDLVTRLHAQPGSLSIGLSSARGGTHDILFGLLMKSAKIPLKGIRVVAFSTTGGAIVQALGGHVDVIVATASPLRPLMSAGKMRALAVSSEKRLDGAPFASVPTCLEEGYDASFSNWRVIIAPPQLTSAQTDYWASVMREVLDSRPFRDYMSRFAMVPDYRTRSQLRDFLASQNSRFTDVLSFLGMIPAR
jgi:putative tricarboxylic transport membrane protein